jgi:hypothetical protein
VPELPAKSNCTIELHQPFASTATKQNHVCWVHPPAARQPAFCSSCRTDRSTGRRTNSGCAGARREDPTSAEILIGYPGAR